MFIVFLENLVLGTFICADNESKIKKYVDVFVFEIQELQKLTYFLSKSHDLPHKYGKCDKLISMCSKRQQSLHTFF